MFTTYSPSLVSLTSYKNEKIRYTKNNRTPRTSAARGNTMSACVPGGTFSIWRVATMNVKPATTFDEQLALLRKRNCFINDPAFCTQVLRHINYYRFSAYFLPFKAPDGTYIKGTSFHRVYRIYEFDRKMRRTLFSIIEEVELYLKTGLAYFHAHKYGPLGYMDASNFGKKHDHVRFKSLFEAEIKHSQKTPFVKHHLENYSGNFPIWVATELFSFGMLSYFYGDMQTQDKKEISRTLYRTSHSNLDSWLRCCTDLRNICAHYGRLYYRIFPAVPATPKGFDPVLGRRLFDQIVMLKFLYPDPNKWNQEVLPSISALFEEYRGDIELEHIGFPDNWDKLLND